MNKIEKFVDQQVDINLDIFRELPISNVFDNVTYASMVTGVSNYSDSFGVEEHKEVKLIQRTFRYRNNLISCF